MNDLIRRQEAIDELENRVYANRCNTAVVSELNRSIGYILKLPTAQPDEQRWIPVTERLPEEETDVLVCNANGEIQISSGSYSTEMKDYFIWYTTGWRFGKVIAWMPLPKPYKKDE